MKFLLHHAVAAAPATSSDADFPSITGADIAGMVHGERVGGDLYHFVRANRSRVVFGLLDVAGTREENHRIVETARQTFQSVATERFTIEQINEAEAMMELCLELNLAIRRAAGGVRSCAAFVGCYNEALGTVCYVNAGHTPGLLRDDSGLTELPATGLPLGLFAASTYEAPTVALRQGASLLLVSRGVVEAVQHKQEFGLDRVKQQFEQLPPHAAADIVRDVLATVQEFRNGGSDHNDITALALVRNSVQAPLAS